MLIITILGLCACQKQQLTIYMSPSVEQEKNVEQELNVENGNYQEILNRCQEKLQQVPENSIEAANLNSIIGGIYAEYFNDREQAVYYINSAIKIHQREGDEIGLAGDYNDMSKIYMYIGGDVQEGLQYLEKAERILIKHEVLDSLELADTLLNKGHLYKKAKQYENALEVFKEAQIIYEKRQEKNVSLHVLTGQVYLELQEMDLAEEQYLFAEQLSIDKNDKYSTAQVRFQLGVLYVNMLDYNQAITYFNQALEFYNTDEIYQEKTAITSNNVAFCYYKNDEIQQGVEASVYACQAIEKVKPLTDKTIEDKKNYKNNLNEYYKIWSKDTSEEGFEKWYQEVVLDGKDWKGVNVEAETKAN